MLICQKICSELFHISNFIGVDGMLIDAWVFLLLYSCFFRLLLTPVSLGAQAFSWAAGKVEPNKIGLPTSPSSTEVQSRVLQAAAKHESQPSDTEETQDPALESATPGTENLDLSEA